MLARVTRALTSTTRLTVLGRLVAVICSVAILTISFAHGVYHLGGPPLVVAAQADAGTPDDSSDISKKAPVAIEHCLGCMTIALVQQAQPFVPNHVARDLVLPIVDEARPHTPVVEIPPPISTI